MEYDLQLKLAEFKINGFTLFEDLVAPAKIDELCAAFLPLLEHVQARETEIGTAEVGDLRTGKGRMQLPSRYTLNWPLDPPFLDPEIYANPVVLGFLESYWETDDFQITCLHSNNPWPGSTLQAELEQLDARGSPGASTCAAAPSGCRTRAPFTAAPPTPRTGRGRNW